ncbi:hypothetical protein AAT19DRAFT_14439 [Rhodotorula toruloides]|uniref:Uncharacterized protein n=1 Tax=Rhodotorula toruloides TaxID=5286 RepID=A0A2T0ABP3_RHOTO|nr:hypothetical protein AAT19DRAFT_14439 [Rhodotorula toruloides]
MQQSCTSLCLLTTTRQLHGQDACTPVTKADLAVTTQLCCAARCAGCADGSPVSHCQRAQHCRYPFAGGTCACVLCHQTGCSN